MKVLGNKVSVFLIGVERKLGDILLDCCVVLCSIECIKLQ